MDRYLIIADNLCPLAPQSLAIHQANDLFEAGHVAKLLLLNKLDAGSASLDATDRMGLESRCEFQAIPVPDRFDLGLLLNVRRLVKQFKPTHIQIFCDDWSRWSFSIRSITRRTVVQTYVPQRFLRIPWLLRNGASRRMQWLVHNPLVKNDLQRQKIGANRIVPCASPSVASPINMDRNSFLGELGLPPSARVVSTVSPLAAAARIKDLIWACDLLKCTRDDVHLLIVGDGQQLNDLKQFAGYTEAVRQIHFLGWSQKAREVVGCSDVYCEPSGRYPNSLALYQAVGNKTPVVVCKDVEKLSHGQDCLKFPVGARNEIARQIRRLLDEPELAQQISESAQKALGRPTTPSPLRKSA